jgi:hypothetical protein
MRTINDTKLEFVDELFYWKALYLYSAVRKQKTMKIFLLKKKLILLYMLKGFKYDYEYFRLLKIYQICYILEIFYRFWKCKWNLFFFNFLINESPYLIRKIFKQIYNIFIKYPYQYEYRIQKLFVPNKLFRSKEKQQKFLALKNVIRFPYSNIRYEDQRECVEKDFIDKRINLRKWRYKIIYFYKLFPFWGLYFVSKWIIYINRIVYYFWLMGIIKNYYLVFLDARMNEVFLKWNCVVNKYFAQFNSFFFLEKELYRGKYFFVFLMKQKFNVIDPLELFDQEILNKNYYKINFYLGGLKNVI